MQNMIIPLEHKYVMLLNPANDDLSRPEYANPQNQDHFGGLPQKQKEVSSKTKTPNRQHKKARTRGRVTVFSESLFFLTKSIFW